MLIKQDNRLAWGVSLLVLGGLFLLKQLEFLPKDAVPYIFNASSYLLIVGGIFLLFHSSKTVAWVLLAVAVWLRLSDIIRLTQSYAEYVWPALFVVGGLVLILTRKRSK